MISAAHAAVSLEPIQKLAKEPWKEYAERAWVDRVGACMCPRWTVAFHDEIL